MTQYNSLNIELIESLPSPHLLHQEFPSLIHQNNFVLKSRQEIQKILHFQDPRLLLIVGPCSIHDMTSIKEFALNLKKLSERVSDSFFIVLRTYFEKPRTTLGWKGFLYDPLLDGSHDMATGLTWTRELLLEFATLQIPTATEFLDPSFALYFSDLISWGCIGARTSSSQIHRQLASALPMPVAFKNNTDGNVEVAINGVIAAKEAQKFIGMNEHGQISFTYSKGNPDGHIVLRGGEESPNYDPESISQAIESLIRNHLLPGLLVDCSHDNSKRRHEEQSRVFQSVFNQFLEGNKSIRGMILESHLNAGNQLLTKNPQQLKYGLSITDSCLDWSHTENLILQAYEKIKKDQLETISVER